MSQRGKQEAASGKARFRLRQSEQLPELVQLLDTILKAEIPAVLPPLLQKLREISALAQDALALADTLLPLVEVLRYGHARQLNLATVEQLLEQLAPRVCIQLPGACQGVQEEVAADILKKVLAVHRALDIWQRQEFIQAWYQALLQIAGQAPPLLAGISSRLLFEQQVHSAAETATEMRFRLSAATPAVEAAQWLEGFLHGSGLLLIHQPALWNILDQWVQELPEAVFPELLPLLRRTFSHFAGPERERMLDMAKSHVQPVASTAGADTEWDAELAAELWPLMQLILGNN